MQCYHPLIHLATWFLSPHADDRPASKHRSGVAVEGTTYTASRGIVIATGS